MEKENKKKIIEYIFDYLVSFMERYKTYSANYVTSVDDYNRYYATIELLNNIITDIIDNNTNITHDITKTLHYEKINCYIYNGYIDIKTNDTHIKIECNTTKNCDWSTDIVITIIYKDIIKVCETGFVRYYAGISNSYNLLDKFCKQWV